MLDSFDRFNRDGVDFGISGVQQSSSSSGGFTISGFVFNDLDRDGQKDGNESGIPNRPVTLKTSVTGNNVVPPTTTNSNGEYVLNNVPEGTHRLAHPETDGWLDTNDNSFIRKIDGNFQYNFGVHK